MQSDFNIFRIFVITFFIFIYTVIYGYICKKKYGNSILILICIISLIPVYYKWKDYQLGIKSAQNAINNFDLIMNIGTRKLIDKNNQEKLKFKDEYIGDEITKYGLHAVFCEIPGTLPSEKANPKSYSNFIGGDCYHYYSQRRYLDPDDPSYVGDKFSKKYKTVQPHQLKYFFKEK